MTWQTIPAEHAKFASPLLLVPGQDPRSSGWRAFAGALGHRGWTSFLLDLPRQPPIGREAWESLLQQGIEAAGTPPILIGHELGASLALASNLPRLATVALSPYLARPDRRRQPGSRWPGWWPAWLRRGASSSRSRPGEGSPAPGMESLLASLPAAASSALSARTEPTLLLVSRQQAPHPPSEEGSLPGGGSVEWLEFDASEVAPGGPGWEAQTGLIHRWLIRRLGEDVLLWLDEEEEEA